jgi:hypothetical protein
MKNSFEDNKNFTELPPEYFYLPEIFIQNIKLP